MKKPEKFSGFLLGRRIDWIIRSCQNNDKLSQVLAKEIPILQERDIWEAIVDVLQHINNDDGFDG